MTDTPPSLSIRQHLSRTLQLALPVIVARAGILLMVAVDIAMTGHAGKIELAYLGIAAAPQVMLLLVGIGMLYGTAVLVAQADGAGEKAVCGNVWRLALSHAAVLGLVMAVLCLGGEQFLLLIGQDADLARGGGGVLEMFAWGMPAVLMGATTSLFLEGINRPLPGMLVMLAANLVNAGLNWLFIYGHWGLPEMGAEGAILATSGVRWLVLAALVSYAYVMPGSGKYGVRQGAPVDWSRGTTLRRIGYPFGFAQGLEASAFATLVLMAGYLGTAALGGYQIAQNLIAMAFMGAVGLGTATAIRVGNAVGRGDGPGLARAGWTGVGLVILLMALIALLFEIWPAALVAIYSSDAEVLALAVPTVVVAGWLLIWDGAQGVLMGALRGAGDVWMPVIMHAVAFWLVGVPLAGLLVFRLGVVAPGLMLGMFGGVVAAALLLGSRFALVSRRPVVRL